MMQPINSPEKRLWTAVILIAANDARVAGSAAREEIQEWVYSRDFEWVCDNADQDAGETRRFLLQLLAVSRNANKSPKPNAEKVVQGRPRSTLGPVGSKVRVKSQRTKARKQKVKKVS